MLGPVSTGVAITGSRQHAGTRGRQVVRHDRFTPVSGSAQAPPPGMRRRANKMTRISKSPAQSMSKIHANDAALVTRSLPRTRHS